jgi:DNA topoisomerase I
MAKKTLVIVESPAKAKTINKYLGSNYMVEASVGHIKDLIKVKLGVDVKNGFIPKYTTIKGKAEIIKKLKSMSEKASDVLIATDPDREGEAIAWHIAEEVKEKNTNIQRVLFNEITKTGIKRGLDEPKSINEDLVMSQQARRVMDRLIGYKVSPFLSRAMLDKTTEALSAGRVQSVALRLICERELEIRNFVPIEYWTISGQFNAEKSSTFKARLVSFDGNMIKNPEGSAGATTEEEIEKIRKSIDKLNFIKNQEQAKELIDRILKESFSIQKITKKQIKRKPSAPFTTSTLQQDASRQLGFTNKRTMMVAQKLYEGVKLGNEGNVGLITYMRTDSVRLSPDAQSAAKDFILKNFGKDYYPDYPNQYTSKSSNVQDAHEAIRPTSLEYSPDEVRKHLTKEEAQLYELIYNRFVASQMSPAVIDQTTIEIEGGKFIFRSTGSVIIFKGFLRVYEDNDGNGNGGESSAILPEGLKEKLPLNLKDIEPSQSFTKPRPRYNEATLVKELDELGIGRPSTYAQIVTTITDRKYVEFEKKSFVPTTLGEDVSQILVKNFPDLFNIDFTAAMEEELDKIAEGNMKYVDMLNEFYEPFQKSLIHAESHSDVESIPCKLCGSPMVIRVSRKGRFLGCSNYPECTNTQPLPKTEKEMQEKKTENEIAEGVTCDLCGKPMAYRDGKYGRFLGCTDYPQCKGIKPLKTSVKCPTCHDGELVERYSPKSKKKFWSCSRYPDCKHITNYEPLNKVCPKCSHYFLEYRFKRVENGFEKYIKCPNCKENFELKQI